MVTMPQTRDRSALYTLALFALSILLLHILTNGQYGFHRDELATFDDARQLAWGYVAYPPVTPIFGRLSQILFGDSLAGARLFPALAQTLVILLAGLMAKEMGGGRTAQLTAAAATAAAPVSMASGALLQYVAFDYLWWVLLAYLALRLINSGDPRWWLGIGTAIGLGMLTKYTMGFYALGIVAGVLFTSERKQLKSPWLWCGVALSVLVFLPNVMWQAHHDFISRDFLKHIHERDVRNGRTSGFLPEQFFIATSIFTVPLWIAGLVSLFRGKDAKPYRMLGWMFIVPLLLFVGAKGRGYYSAPAYPMLFAAGAVWPERWLASLSQDRARALRVATIAALGVAMITTVAVAVPLAPVNSRWWRVANKVNGDFREEIGWHELVEAVARVRDSVPETERPRLGIIAGNYGEAGAIDLYGPAYGLPKAISGINSYWLKGYPDPPPQTVIVVGLSEHYAHEIFESCELAGHVTNRYGVLNEETQDHPDIWLCRNLRQPWPEFWKDFRYFG